MTRRLLACLALTTLPLTASAKDELFSIHVRQPGVDLNVQELIRNKSTSTVQSLQRVPHSKPAKAALPQAIRLLAQKRGARYFRLESPYAETTSGQLRIVHFYRYPAIFSLRRIYSVKGPTAR